MHFHRKGWGRLPSSPSRFAKPLRRHLQGNYPLRRLLYIPRSPPCSLCEALMLCIIKVVDNPKNTQAFHFAAHEWRLRLRCKVLVWIKESASSRVAQLRVAKHGNASAWILTAFSLSESSASLGKSCLSCPQCRGSKFFSQILKHYFKKVPWCSMLTRLGVEKLCLEGEALGAAFVIGFPRVYKPMLNTSCAISQAKPLGYPNWSGFRTSLLPLMFLWFLCLKSSTWLQS